MTENREMERHVVEWCYFLLFTEKELFIQQAVVIVEDAIHVVLADFSTLYSTMLSSFERFSETCSICTKTCSAMCVFFL